MPRMPYLALGAALLFGALWQLSSNESAADGLPALSHGSVKHSAKRTSHDELRAKVPTLDVLSAIDSAKVVNGRLVTSVDGRAATLSVDPELQRHAQSVLEQFNVPAGAIVALDPLTGRVLAYANHHEEGAPEFHGQADIAADVSAPAASVFKVVTASALFDAGVKGESRTCYSGGSKGLRARHLEDRDTDRQCASLSEAMAYSTNAVFAKLADRHLDPKVLGRYAGAFAFGSSVLFDGKVKASPIDIPTERLEFARTSAGFWHTQLSPIHAALLAATIANDGHMPRPTLIDELKEGNEVIYTQRPENLRSVIPRRTARAVGNMMRGTVSMGTARKYFYDQAGNPFLPGIAVAGKTGSLAGQKPYRGYSWFVGYAPVSRPTIAVAALVINSGKWRIKGAYAAREVLRYHLVEQAAKAKKAKAKAKPPTPGNP